MLLTRGGNHDKTFPKSNFCGKWELTFTGTESFLKETNFALGPSILENFPNSSYKSLRGFHC